MRKSIIAVFLLPFMPIFSFAQLHWKKVDSLFGQLPASFHVFRAEETLDDSPFIAYYVSAVLKDKELEFTTEVSNGNPYTPDIYYEAEKNPLLIVNGGFFSFENGQNLNVVIRNGKLVAYNVNSLRGIEADSMLFYYPTRSAIGISKKRQADVSWIFTNPDHNRAYAFETEPVIAKGRVSSPTIFDLKNIHWRWWEMHTAIGGGPNLLHEGKIWITNKEEQMFVGEENKRDPRTAMGYTRDGRLIILVIQGRFPGKAAGASLVQEARILRDLDCYEALNLGGGGSSCMLINGKETIRPSEKIGQRPVPSVFIIKWTGKK